MGWPTTNAGWLTLLKEWVNITTLSTTQIQTCMDLATERLNRDLSSQWMESPPVSFPVPPATTWPVNLATLVTDFNRIILVNVDNGKPYEGRAINEMIEAIANKDTALIYAIQGQQLYLNPAPAEASIVKLWYYKKIPAIATGGPETNVFTQNHPDAYLFSSLVEVSKYVDEDERLPVFVQTYTDIAESINGTAKKAKIGATPLTRNFSALPFRRN